MTAGMRPPRQAVDDGHRRIFRKLQQRIVIEDADHDGVDIARQHACGVGDGLAAAELHLGTGEHDGLAAKLAHGDVERHAGAGRGALEDHRQRLAFERPDRLMRLLLRLHGGGRRKHALELRQRQLVDIEEMLRSFVGGLAHQLAARLVWLDEIAEQARSSRPMLSSISASVTISGGRKRTTLSPAPTVSSFS